MVKKPQFWGPEIGHSIIKKIAKNSETVPDREKVTKIVGLSESVVILVAWQRIWAKRYTAHPKYKKAS